MLVILVVHMSLYVVLVCMNVTPQAVSQVKIGFQQPMLSCLLPWQCTAAASQVQHDILQNTN